MIGQQLIVDCDFYYIGNCFVVNWQVDVIRVSVRCLRSGLCCVRQTVI